jgi:hypothetical protein
LGEIDGNGSSLPGSPVYGLKIFDGTGTADSDIIVELGTSENKIAGWTIGTDTISSNNLILHSSGRIETANFASGQKGWRIDSLQNGRAEFENVKIRGTLSTTVFEKETVNAVGGQLYVANSSTITSSAHHPQGTVSASNATMSLVNVSGFATDEILAIKKVSNTGFSTEYVQVISASRFSGSSDTNLSGLLFVTRSYGGGIDETGTGLSSSLGDPAFLTAQQYEDGQVVVSTGKLLGGTGQNTTGSGFIRINANPNDLSTPFIDIVERTGSAIYDVDIKARLGDLSGLSSQFVRGADVKGFGLVTSNVFLTSSFFVGGVNEHISFETGSFEAKLKKLNLDTTGLKIQGEGSGASNRILLGSATAKHSGNGIFMAGNSVFRVGGTTNNYMSFESGSLEVVGKITISNPGDIDISDLNNDSGFTDDTAANSAQSTANTANTAASNAVTTANSANTAASNAQSAVDTIEEKVVITGQAVQVQNSTADKTIMDSGIVSIVSNNVTASKFTNTGLQLYTIDTTTNTASLDKQGLTFVKGGVTRSFFGDTATIGRTDQEHVKVSSTGVELKDNTTTFGKFASTTTIGNTGAEHVSIGTTGVDLKDNTTTYGRFAATTTIGDTSTEHISISNSELRLKDGSTTRILMNSSGLTMGNHISIDSSGDASFSGTLSVGGTTLTTGNTLNANTSKDDVGLGNVDNDSTSTIRAGTTKANVGLGNVENLTAQNQAQTGLIAGTTITGGGITLNSGGVIKTINKDSVSDTTAGFFMGYDGSGAYDFAIGDANSFLKWDGSASSLNIKGSITITNPGDIDISDLNNDSGFTNDDTANAAQLQAASAQSTANTANTAAGNANTAAGNAQSAVDVIEEKVVITGAAVQVQNSTADKTIIDSGIVSIVQGNVTSSLFTATNSEIRGGTLASKTTASFDKAGVRFIDAGVTQSLFGANLTQIGVTTGSHIQMSGSGLELLDGSTTRFGVDTTGVNIGDPANEHVRITDSGVNIKDGVTSLADYGSTVRIGKTGEGRVEISDTAISMYSGQSTPRKRVAIDSSGKIAIGGASGADVSVSSDEDVIRITPGSGVSIFDSADNKAVVNSDGLKVFKGDASNPVAQFGTTTFVGKEATEHIKITNSSLEIIDGATSTTFASFGSTTKIGDTGNEHVEINSNFIEMKDQTTTLAKFGETTIIGQEADRHIQINDTDVRVKQGGTVKSIFGASSITLGHNSTNNEHVIIDENGLSVKDGGDTLAVFGATTTIGKTTGNSTSRIEIASDAVSIINRDSGGTESTVLSFDDSGDIVSNDFLIERTRLFGAGGDGDVVLKYNTATIATGSGLSSAGLVVSSSTAIESSDGTKILSRTGSVWHLEGDLYSNNLSVFSTGGATTLKTNGFRIFTRVKLAVTSSCIIHNDGGDGGVGANGTQTSGTGTTSAAAGGTAGAGGGRADSSLAKGSDGGAGGTGGTYNSTNDSKASGGGGGGAGGTGGIVFISARTIANSGTIRANGGDGGNGGNGGITSP